MPTKEEWLALIAEYNQRRANGETHKAICADLHQRGIHLGTFHNNRIKYKPEVPLAPEAPMPETAVEVLPGQIDIEDADTPPVYAGAVQEYETLPAGYAQTIQPMQPYSDAEEWALNKSMEIYGFLGAIVLDQYGRTIDGNQRQRIARHRGLGVPHTITRIRDDAHAIEIARTLNTVRRHYTRAQREELAPLMRDQGFTYDAIAEALGVGKATVYRDVMGVLQVRQAAELVPQEPVSADGQEEIVPRETISGVAEKPPQPIARVQRKGGGTYPAQRQPALKPKEPAPRKPARQEVQDTLVAALKGIRDQDAWPLLADLWVRLDAYWREAAPADSSPARSLTIDLLNRLTPLFPAKRG